MSRSGQPKLSEVAAIFRLAREACELGDDPVTWRKHVLAELSRHRGFTWSGSMLMPLDFNPSAIRFLLTVFFFGDSTGHDRWVRYLSAGSCDPDPCTPKLRTMLHRQFSCIRPQVCEERAWYMSPYFNEFRRPMDQDDLLFSYLPLSQFGCASAFGFTRSLKDPPFSEIDRKLLHLFHQELGRLWTTPPLSNNSCLSVALSHRMRQTLDLLAAGNSEKQVAAHLCISRHTVHDHVKELHRRLGVSSLGELLAKARPIWRYRPHLGLDPLPPAPRNSYNLNA